MRVLRVGITAQKDDEQLLVSCYERNRSIVVQLVGSLRMAWQRDKMDVSDGAGLGFNI
jgi:hypothetical protein